MSVSEQSTALEYPVHPEFLPELPADAGRYSICFARSIEELHEVQRLRFEVFNVEMGEGLEESFATGRDEDRFDPFCHHLVVRETAGGSVIGTYRMQTDEMARRFIGYYSAEEFDFSGLPESVLQSAIEVGRACVAKPYRNRHVLFLLWKGLAAYLERNRKRYLFGCCSLTSQDCTEGRRVMRYLKANGHVHPELRLQPRSGWECYREEDSESAEPLSIEGVKLPKLFSLYLRYSAKVLGPPALDRCFKTIDYFVVLDTEELAPETRAVFFR